MLLGFPQVVLKKSVNKDKDGKIVNDKIVEFANRGFRSLGISKNSSMVILPSFRLLRIIALRNCFHLLLLDPSTTFTHTQEHSADEE